MPPGLARAAVPLDTVKFAGIEPGNILIKGLKAHRAGDHAAPVCALRPSVGTIPQVNGEEEPRHRQLPNREPKNDQGHVERTKRQVSAASDRRKQRFRDLIETERHAARLKPEPPFDEGRKAISRHCGSGSQRTQPLRQTHEDCGAGGKKNSCGDASPSLGTTE